MKKLLFIPILGLIAGCGQVNTGEAGFFTRWGEITSREPLSEGLHFFEPIGTSLVKYNIQNQTISAKTDAFTKDIQSMVVNISVTYHLERNKIIDLHSRTGRNYERAIIAPALLGSVKDEIGKLEADMIVSKREIVTQSIEQNLREMLKSYGISVSFVKILNIDYSDAFERAVEEKQVALQKSIKEQNETKRLREVANQSVVKAEADARVRVLNSEAEAKAILVKAEAEAKAIEMKNKALASSTSLIEYTLAQQWNGKLPDQMLGSTPVPFINVMSKANGGAK